ncbi:AraC family transcriptional regulator [Paenibacillus cisolokensis]|uniref:AraC family transcriptional regulator n=1 Tax=Paenibacillus TaxID=44249 RepID=UPI00071F7387|nr:AraC family transcriptional regulator [Paenibacillus sp. 32O-W]ALS29173.1 AraC family transcriptional regulator [Paenibacillus sp. 32O-W]
MKAVSLYDPEWTDGDYRFRIDAYYYKQWNGFKMPFHSHPTAEMMYVISGRCTVETETESGTETFRLRKGDFILLDAEVRHRLLVGDDSPSRMLNVEFAFAPQTGAVPTLRAAAAAERALGEMLAGRRPYIVLRDTNDVYHNLKSLVLELDETGREDGWMVQLQMSELLIRVARLARQAEHDGKSYDPYVSQAIRFIRQNYDRDIQIRDIAAFVSLHPGYLQRIFRERMGRTLTDYLTELRIEKAKMLLSRTDLPVADIPEYIGINSREYFSALFKKRVGQSPAAFRQSREMFVR